MSHLREVHIHRRHLVGHSRPLHTHRLVVVVRHTLHLRILHLVVVPHIPLQAGRHIAEWFDLGSVPSRPVQLLSLKLVLTP